MEKQKRDDPGGSSRYGLDNLHLADPVLGAMLWCDLPYPWEGSLRDLLDTLSANVEDCVKKLPEWPSSPQELYEYLRSLDGYLFGLHGGNVEIELGDHSQERPEETRVRIELIFREEIEEDDPVVRFRYHIGLEFDLD